MLTEHAFTLLRLLRRWSVGSVDKFALEMQLPSTKVEEAAKELLYQHLILAFNPGDAKDKILEITGKGISFLNELDGPIDTFPDKV